MTRTDPSRKPESARKPRRSRKGKSSPSSTSPTTAATESPEPRDAEPLVPEPADPTEAAAPDPEINHVRPQPGPQSKFFETKADIAIYGGAAGGGKTWALLLEPLRHRQKPDFAAVFFRRTTVQIRNPGGLWDESSKLYAPVQGEPFAAALEWRFPTGARVKFAHLEHEKTVLDWQGAQLPLIAVEAATTGHAFVETDQ